ncbi:hypothetical protein NEPAR04_1138 [Nematocida parisii]|nr:hypothetical protein NEPAR08_0918 [Nematocida parisii]KAI5127823.1 hypothetical protein NEPAR03_1103 [Nematocida parisii]KAI5141661.1 hypothetical protein NEPAR04_1138 [Nematocida parisii]
MKTIVRNIIFPIIALLILCMLCSVVYTMMAPPAEKESNTSSNTEEGTNPISNEHENKIGDILKKLEETTNTDKSIKGENHLVDVSANNSSNADTAKGTSANDTENLNQNCSKEIIVQELHNSASKTIVLNKNNNEDSQNTTENTSIHNSDITENTSNGNEPQHASNMDETASAASNSAVDHSISFGDASGIYSMKVDPCVRESVSSNIKNKNSIDIEDNSTKIDELLCAHPRFIDCIVYDSIPEEPKPAIESSTYKSDVIENSAVNTNETFYINAIDKSNNANFDSSKSTMHRDPQNNKYNLPSQAISTSIYESDDENSTTLSNSNNSNVSTVDFLESNPAAIKPEDTDALDDSSRMSSISPDTNTTQTDVEEHIVESMQDGASTYSDNTNASDCTSCTTEIDRINVNVKAFINAINQKVTKEDAEKKLLKNQQSVRKINKQRSPYFYDSYFVMKNVQNTYRKNTSYMSYSQASAISTLKKYMKNGSIALNTTISIDNDALPCNIDGLSILANRLFNHSNGALTAPIIEHIKESILYLQDLTNLTRFCVINEIETITGIWSILFGKYINDIENGMNEKIREPYNFIVPKLDEKHIMSCKSEIQSLIHMNYTAPVNFYISESLKKMANLFILLDDDKNPKIRKFSSLVEKNPWFVKMPEKSKRLLCDYVEKYWALDSQKEGLFLCKDSHPVFQETLSTKEMHEFYSSVVRSIDSPESSNPGMYIFDGFAHTILNIINSKKETTTEISKLGNFIIEKNTELLFNQCLLKDAFVKHNSKEQKKMHPLFLNSSKLLHFTTSHLLKTEREIKHLETFSTPACKSTIDKIKKICGKLMQAGANAINQQLFLLSLQRSESNSMQAVIYASLFEENSEEIRNKLYEEAYPMINRIIYKPISTQGKEANSKPITGPTTNPVQTVSFNEFKWSSIDLPYDKLTYESAFDTNDATEHAIKSEYKSYIDLCFNLNV